MTVSKKLVVGVFVGGRAVRFGGVVKGLLRVPETNEPIVMRLARVTREALPDSEFVLVGDAREYASTPFRSIADDPGELGPIGALTALLSHASSRGLDAIALAGDLPFVSPELLGRLSRHAQESTAVAPRLDGIWHPLFARYRSDPSLEAARAVLASGGRALYRVIARLGSAATELPLTADEVPLLRDWDTPEDVAR